jgi:hypothetical protein
MDENGVAIAVRYNDEMKELSSVMSRSAETSP